MQQFSLAGSNLFPHGVQFGVCALDFSITIAHVLAETSTFGFEATGLFLQWLQRASQFVGTGLGISQTLPGFDFVGAGLLELVA